jgi:WD40 repeat protein
MDGTLVVYDKEKEDAEFVPDEVTPVENGQSHESGPEKPRFRVLKSVQSRNQKANPVAAWKASNMKINDIEFSPDGQLLAMASDDGCLSIIDYVHERVLDVYRSYYGGMLCVTWSPDSRYVLSGGQDDLVCIWSVADRALVARCVGHESWVTDVKFDPWRCDERNYRFGSVGEDCRLLLWDFSVGMLGRPRVTRQRGSVSSHFPSDRKANTAAAAVRFRSNSNLTQILTTDTPRGDEVVHPVDSKASTVSLPPVMSKSIDPHPLCWLGFEADSIITSCKDGELSSPDVLVSGLQGSVGNLETHTHG